MSTARAVVAARAAWVLVALVAIGVALAARFGHVAKSESEPHVPRQEVPSPPPLAVTLPPPAPTQVDSALRRAFGDAVRPVEGARALIGDFNGDGTEDVAVPVGPAEGRLVELNDEAARWQLQDALAPPPKAMGTEQGEPATVKIEEADKLLAVIHGYGPHGWRNDEARQSYLVRHATGAPLETMARAELFRYVNRAPSKAPPTGDVIQASSGDRAGVVYWTGARYSWHPLPSRARPVSNRP